MSIRDTNRADDRLCTTALGVYAAEVERLLDISLDYGLAAERKGTKGLPSTRYLNARAQDYWCAAARSASQADWRQRRPRADLIRFAEAAA